ncbi:NUDIX hydrolase [Hyphomonas sp. L-53-1-40]|uniref:NUDIX hydrolase n=1 Tax=Hyphomonas sp. L-53-1-40 TaxID=1207058 RepID=UPI000A615D28|nr:NUDIX hydrolase [Hyphomonas sp. L-53-1-40]
MAGTNSRSVVPAVGTVCFRGDDVLLIQRGTKPLQGEWSLPGGRIEAGERATLAEETGITARLVGLIDVVDAIFTSRGSGDVTRHYLLFDYAAVWMSGSPVAGDDAAHAEWISPARLATLPLWDETRRIINSARHLVHSSNEA